MSGPGRVVVTMEAKEYNKLQRSRKAAFMMAWHPRLGEDSLIRKYVPKDVGKLIAHKLELKHTTTCVGLPLDQIELELMRPTCYCDSDSDCDHPGYPEIRIKNPPLFRGQKLRLQTPRLIMADSSDGSSIRVESRDKLVAFMAQIQSKIATALDGKEIAAPDAAVLEYSLTKYAKFFKRRAKQCGSKDALVTEFKKGCAVFLILELVEDRWVVPQALLRERI